MSHDDGKLHVVEGWRGYIPTQSARWAGECRHVFTPSELIGTFVDPERPPGTYTGPNLILEGVATDPADALLPASVRKLLRYYVREIKRSGTERRSVYLEIVGTGRTMRMGRREYERKVRPG